MPAPKITAEQRAEIARRYREGETEGVTLDTLAAAFGVSKSAIAYHLKKAQVARRAFSPFKAKALTCPFTPAQLERWRWTERQSLADIGRRAAARMGRPTVHNATVQRWLREADVPLREGSRPATPSDRSRRYSCPFTPGRLEELHWRQGRTLSEVGRAAQSIAGWERAPSCQVVKNWFLKAGVRTRTLSEVARLRMLHFARTGTGPFSPEAREKARQGAIQRSRPLLTTEGKLRPARTHSPETRRKISQGVSRTKQAQRPAGFLVTRPCACCAEPVTRPRSVMQKPRVFCSRACQGRALAQERGQARHARSLVTRPCGHCGQPVTRIACQMRSENAFCNRACLNLWRRRKYQSGLSDAQRQENKRRLVAEAEKRRELERENRLTRKCALPECPNAITDAAWRWQQTATVCCCRECAHELHRRRMQARFEAQAPARESILQTQSADLEAEGWLDVRGLARRLGVTEICVRTRIGRGQIVPDRREPRLLFRADAFPVPDD